MRRITCVDDNELGEYRGRDSREWLHDDDGTVFAYFGLGYQSLYLERSEDLEMG